MSTFFAGVTTMLLLGIVYLVLTKGNTSELGIRVAQRVRAGKGTFLPGIFGSMVILAIVKPTEYWPNLAGGLVGYIVFWHLFPPLWKMLWKKVPAAFKTWLFEPLPRNDIR